MVPEVWNKPFWERVWPYLDPWGSVRLRTASTHWNVPKKYGPPDELFFFLLKEEPMVVSELADFEPCVSAETVKACALIGLHMTAEENALRSDRDSSPDLGEMWKYGCTKSPVWSGDGLDEERGEDASAIEVVGQNWTSEVISLFLEDWEVGRASSCHLSVDLLCQEMRDACGAQSLWITLAPCVRSAKEALWWNCHSSNAFLSPWTGCDNKRKNLVRDLKEKERERRALLSCAGCPVSFEILMFGMVGLWREGVISFPSCRLVVFGCSKRIFNALI